MKDYIVLGLVALILVLTIFQTLQISSLTGNVVKSSSATGALDMSGWTENEKMNYEMHGIIPAGAGGSSASSAGAQMVGGC